MEPFGCRRFDNTGTDEQSLRGLVCPPNTTGPPKPLMPKKAKPKVWWAMRMATAKTEQTMTYLSTEGLTATAEPIYDHLGRPAVNPLRIGVCVRRFTVWFAAQCLIQQNPF